jgi:ATP-dependent Lon protease
MNPIIFIDELDKVSKTEHGKEIIGILTHLIDGTQNDSFQDKYFNGIDLDLSKALFVFSYNDVSSIDKILLDRIHRIKFEHLTIEDKLVITKKHILPELYKKMGVENCIEITDENVVFIIENYTNEPGIRKFKELLFEIIGEINLSCLKDYNSIELPITISNDDIKYKFLKERHEILEKKIPNKSNIGVINGLWANSMGQGGIIPIEARLFPSTSFMDLKLTGLQGDVMKESMTVSKTLATTLVETSILKNKVKEMEETKIQGIHIHCPEGSVPKDGPSAGTAITCVLYSLLTERKIKNTIAITGEINLQGCVTAIGGLDLKILGGIKGGVKEFIYPKENEKDFKTFMEKYGEKDFVQGIQFHPVENINQVLTLIFE